MHPFWSILSDAAFLLIWFGVPVCVFLYKRPKSSGGNLGARFIVAVLGVWLGLLLHREIIGFPVALAHAHARGNLEYDGTGTNAVLLVLGWIFGVISSAVTLGVFLIWQRIRQRQ